MNKKACIIAVGDWGSHKCLLKNRDRNYTPKVKVVQELIDGVEVAYVWDTETNWSEGLNEYHIGVVNTALSVQRDENEMANIQTTRKKLKDGRRMQSALAQTTIDGAIHVICEYEGGVRGHNFVADLDSTYTVELKKDKVTRETSCEVKQLANEKMHVRTNHGLAYPEEGYTEGPDFESSTSRYNQALRVLKKVKEVAKIAPTLVYERKSDFKDPNNMVRDTDNMRTTTQMVVDLTALKLLFYVIPGKSKFLGVENRLPEGYTPRIKVEVYKYKHMTAPDPGIRQLVASPREKQAKAGSFKYKGLTLSNPENLSERSVRLLLTTVDDLVEVFKKAGLAKSLYSSVKVIELKTEPEEPGVLADYDYQLQKIRFYLTGNRSKGRALWSVIHEIAHHIYFHVLHSDAKEEWSHPWKRITDKLDVTAKDRKRYFALIKSSGWNPQAAHAKLKKIDAVKFAFWLHWTWAEPLIDASGGSLEKVELNIKGELYFNAFKDPRLLVPYIKKFIPKHVEDAEQYAPKLAAELRERLQENLGLHAVSPYPRLGHPTMIGILLQHEPALAKFFEGLKSPTEYAKSSGEEEFAETFTAVLLAPTTVEKNLRRRLLTALGLSNLYGKDIWREDLS